MNELRAEFLRHLGLSTFIVVDLETTGLDPEKDQIIEIGAIKFTDGQEVEFLEQLIDPGIPIPEFITRLTGISDDDVENMPKIEDFFPRLDQFLGGAAFVGQQVNFDASFIEYHYRKTNNDFHNWDNKMMRFKYLDNLRLDTLFIARIMMPFLASFKLADLAKHLGYDLEKAHRAVEDARATGHVFLELLDRTLAVDNHLLSSIINLLYPNSVRAKSFFVPALGFKKMKNIIVSSAPLMDDVKHAQQYYNIIGEIDYSHSFREDVQLNPVNTESIINYFAASGKLAQLIENYELRKEQQNMAQNTAEAFNRSEFLVAEAGTGTGKSMAYLLPAVEWALQNREAGQRIIVSTKTKNLQEQLFFKDIPMVFAATGGQFSAVLLKGRSNYLCLEKWRSVMTDMNQRLSQDERSRVLPLVLWVEQTRTGDIAENSGFQLERNMGLWFKFIAESSYCPGKACKFYRDCFLMKARESARHADLVIVNHSLLFSDLAAGHSILEDYRNLIIDEAHNIEESAAEYMGVRISYWSFRNIYHKLYEEDPKRTGTLQQLDFRISRGRLDEDTSNKIFRESKRLKQQSISLKEKVQIFYNEFSRLLREKYKNGKEESKVRYFKNFKYFNILSQHVEDLQDSISKLNAVLSRFIDILADIKDDQFEFQDQIYRELNAIKADTAELMEAFGFCIKAENENYVYWLDMPRTEKSNDVVLHAVPLNIAELLKAQLFNHLDTAVFTSATLAVSGKFNYFSERTGLNLLEDKTVNSQIFGSPFNFKEQLTLGVTDFLPDPRNAEFPEELAANIMEIHDRYKAGMLVLFTSYGLLNMIYDKLKPHFDSERILLLAQGKSGSRMNIMNQFKENRDSVLLGTDSFWEGVDVPGNALEILYIPKLPFDVPTEPIVAARMEEIKKHGGNPFFDYSVPEAIIKFRQGFGRLIRTKIDSGAVIVGDNRLSRMQYGKQFLDSLPVQGNIYRSSQDLFNDLDKWFSQNK